MRGPPSSPSEISSGPSTTSSDLSGAREDILISMILSRTVTNSHTEALPRMGLLTIIRKNREKERAMRILFLGLDNAGKTTILKKLNGEDVKGVSPTLGFNIKTFIHGKYTLNIWDVGGQKTLRPYWRNYFEQTDAIVWVVDSCDHLRIQDCKQELHALLTEDRLAGASLLVFANKQDIQGAMDDSQISEALDLRSIRTHHWKIWPCSAMTGDNLTEGLHWMVNDVATRLYYNTTMSLAHAHPQTVDDS